MNNLDLVPFSITSLLINLLVCGASFYSAWNNLLRNQISKFGFDAFLLSIGQIIDKKQAAKVRKDPKLIRRMGIMMVLFGLGSLYAILIEIIEAY